MSSPDEDAGGLNEALAALSLPEPVKEHLRAIEAEVRGAYADQLADLRAQVAALEHDDLRAQVATLEHDAHELCRQRDEWKLEALANHDACHGVLRAQLAERETELERAADWVAGWIDLESRVCDSGDCQRIGVKETEAPLGYAYGDSYCDEHAPDGAKDVEIAAAVRWLEGRKA